MNKVTAVFIGALLAFAVCLSGCDKESADQDKSKDILVKEKLEETDPVLIRIMFGDALGYEKCYCESVSLAGPWIEWNLYNENGEMIAMQFGFNDYEPYLYPLDLDGDGEDELISSCVYGGDGANRVFVYRNNNGEIEVGVYVTDMCTVEYSMEYFEKNNDIILHNWSVQKDVELGMDDFEFSRFDPENFPW